MRIMCLTSVMARHLNETLCSGCSRDDIRMSASPVSLCMTTCRLPVDHTAGGNSEGQARLVGGRVDTGGSWEYGRRQVVTKE